MEVAGMGGSSTFHMQALVTLANGTTFKDSDHTFVTGAAPLTAPVQVSTPTGQTPQPGIELYDTVQYPTYVPNMATAMATDISGNVIWAYQYPTTFSDVLFPIKPLPNGNFLLYISFAAQPIPLQTVPGTLN